MIGVNQVKRGQYIRLLGLRAEAKDTEHERVQCVQAATGGNYAHRHIQLALKIYYVVVSK